VLHIHRVIHGALEQAMRCEPVASNVAKLVDPPQARHFEMSVLSVEQVHRVLDAAEGPPREALIAVAVSTGMRKGELLALRWADVDVERRVVG
jgi:integrase